MTLSIYVHTMSDAPAAKRVAERGVLSPITEREPIFCWVLDFA